MSKSKSKIDRKLKKVIGSRIKNLMSFFVRYNVQDRFNPNFTKLDTTLLWSRPLPAGIMIQHQNQ
jgi:hypothetical protein